MFSLLVLCEKHSSFFFLLVNLIESNKGQFDTEHNWVVYLDIEPNTSANRKYM